MNHENNMKQSLLSEVDASTRCPNDGDIKRVDAVIPDDFFDYFFDSTNNNHGTANSKLVNNIQVKHENLNEENCQTTSNEDEAIKNKENEIILHFEKKVDATSFSDDDLPADFFEGLQVAKTENVIECGYQQLVPQSLEISSSNNEHSEKLKNFKFNECRNSSREKRKHEKAGIHMDVVDPPNSSKKNKIDLPIRVRNEFLFKETLPEQSNESIKLKSMDNIYSNAQNSLSQIKISNDHIERFCNLNEKRKISLKNSILIKKELQKKNFYQQPMFQYINTVRKLPKSKSIFIRKQYEDRSPLNAITNVEYAFNSTVSKIKLSDFGLERTPSSLKCACQFLGINASSLYEKMLIIKIPPTVQIDQNKLVLSEQSEK